MCKFLLTTILLVFMPLTASCSTTDWQWDFNHIQYFGTSPSASDDHDSLDVLVGATGKTHLGVYHEQGVDGWSGDTGFYKIDIRSPLSMTPGDSKTWRFYLWGAIDYYPPQDMTGFSWFGDQSTDTALQSIEFAVTYVRSAVGIVDNHINAVGDYRILNDHPDGATWGNFPACRVSNGLDGYIFDLTATVVPEPSALAALGFGLLPLGGFALRRRRHV